MRYPFALADKEIGPQPNRRDFTTLEGYHTAWYYWRAVRRDAYPTRAEQDAAFAVLVRRLGYEPEDFQ